MRLHPPVSALLVESTGAARPWPLIAALTQNPAFHLRHFIVTVDALNLHRDWEDGAALDAQSIADPALRAAAAVLVEQARFAGIIVLTKTDTVPKAASQRMIHHLRQLNPRAAIALSSHGGLQLEQLESIAPPRLDRLKGLAEKLGLTAPGAAATAADVDCLIFKDRPPFHPRRLWECCRSQMGTGLYRTKGFLWLASRPGQVLLWQQAGSQISFELMGLWRAELALNRDGKLLPEEVAHLRQLLESEDAVFGDRHIEMTLIGLPEARESFARALRECLCTDAEVEAWQRGETFEDPWPVTLRRTA